MQGEVRYRTVRATTERLAAPLGVEDQMVQSLPQASPTKWHRAHTTWFFEEFVLSPHLPGYRPFHPGYGAIFNSYYESLGPRFERTRRGVLSRPTAEEVSAYRRHVDEHMGALLAAPPPAAWGAIEIGIAHEEQHQELLLTDIKHALASNPLRPVYLPAAPPEAARPAPPLRWLPHPGGPCLQGADDAGFALDHERPRHRLVLRSFALASRLVTCGEYLEFIRDGGYRRPTLWLSDGWTAAQAGGWHAPLYWEERDGGHWHYTLSGPRPVDPAEPVAHVSFYEADAFARWAGARLPTEAEWEQAAAAVPVAGNLLEAGRLHPAPAPAGDGPAQLWGDVWEWTASAYAAYPGFRPPAGPLGEYNAKFMCNQLVLRGGSCLTPAAHLRPSYRNFFPPETRWQASGIRLARDA